MNLIFEEGMYSLTNDLEQLVKALRDAGVQFEIVGGVAVNAHIFLEHRSRSFVTRDIDVLIRRNDLEQVAKATESLGSEAVHLVFAGEKSRTTQAQPHPELHPEEKHLSGIAIPVAPLRDLLQMKLNAFRLKDLVHIEILDDAGLITPAVERELPEILQQRLTEARQRIAADKPDVEG
ncbi:MAG TPA: hypothetical protein VME43_29615 [Bryobacteraceae bacterium]|nr:hypothetical protein [Bryobacteraceae bacterium]